MKHQDRGLDYKYPCELQAFKLIPQAQLLITIHKVFMDLMTVTLFFPNADWTISNNYHIASDKSVAWNKIKIITNCIRIDLCIWHFQIMYITAIHRPWRKHRGGICRYKTFWMRIFERTTFLLLRCCSIHGKLCVLATYSARNWV